MKMRKKKKNTTMMQRLLKEKMQKERAWKVVPKREMKEMMGTCARVVMKQESHGPRKAPKQIHQLGWKTKSEVKVEPHDDA